MSQKSTRRALVCWPWVSTLSSYITLVIFIPFLQITVEDNELQGNLTAFNFALRAYERFLSEYGNIPGECTVEQDIGRLKSIAGKMMSDLGMHATISDDVLHEICRYGGAELHAVSAFIGA